MSEPSFEPGAAAAPSVAGEAAAYDWSGYGATGVWQPAANQDQATSYYGYDAQQQQQQQQQKYSQQNEPFRDRNRERDRDRDRDRYNDRDSRDYDNDRWERDRYDDGGRDRRRPDNYSRELSRELIFRGCGDHTTEQDVSAVLGGFASCVTSIRLPRQRSNGLSKGFGFLDFATVADAEAFLKATNGFLNLGGPRPAQLEYARESLAASSRSGAGGNGNDASGDWICQLCAASNFQRREKCYKCSVDRDISESDDLRQIQAYHFSEHPCKVLCCTEVSPVTTDDSLRQGFAQLAGLTEVHIIRNNDGLSRGYAFLRFDTVQHATLAREYALQPMFHLIDNARVRVEFARFDIFSDRVKRYGVSSNPTANIGAGHQPLSKQNPQSASATMPIPQWQNVPPLHGAFVLDPSSGYFYDAASGYYYHPATQLYYKDNMTFVYDATTGTYTDTVTREQVKKEKEKEKVKTVQAKKTAKDMARWEKKQRELQLESDANSATSAAKVSASAAALLETAASAVAAATAAAVAAAAAASSGAAVPSTLATGSALPSSDLPPPPPLTGANAQSVELCENAIQTATDLDMADSMIDMVKLACLLCKRKFNSAEILQRHCVESTLHLTNLDLFRNSTAYRDRAAERRTQHNQPDKPVLADPYGYGSKHTPKKQETPEQPNVKGISESNIGNQMLQKMGWSSGQGLGANGGGIVEPVQALRHAVGAGIGADIPIDAQIESGDKYKDIVLKKARARFQALAGHQDSAEDDDDGDDTAGGHAGLGAHKRTRYD